MSGKLNTMLNEAILDFLLEEEDKNPAKEKEKTKAQDPKAQKKDAEKSKTGASPGSLIFSGGAFGSGAWSQGVEVSKTRAKEDPAGLLRDLGVGNASGSTDVQRAVSILKQAISKNKVMSKAFDLPSRVSIEDVERGRSVEAYEIPPAIAGMSYREATGYIYLVLYAAEKTGALRLENGINFANRNLVKNPTIFGT